MRPYGSSTDINVLCKNQSSPAQSAQHHRLLAPCMLAHADGYHMLTPVYASLSFSPYLLYAPDKKCEPSKASGQIETARGIQNTCLSGGSMSSFFSLFLLCSLLHLSSNRLTPSIYLFFPLGGFCLVVPSRRHPFPFPLILSTPSLWPASYTPLFVAEVVVILNYKRGIVHGDFSLYFPSFIFVIGSPTPLKATFERKKRGEVSHHYVYGFQHHRRKRGCWLDDPLRAPGLFASITKRNVLLSHILCLKLEGWCQACWEPAFESGPERLVARHGAFPGWNGAPA